MNNDKEDNSFKLLTLNIWDLPNFSLKRKERIEKIAEFVKNNKITIVCFQESFDLKNRKKISEILGPLYFFNGIKKYRRILWHKFDDSGGLAIFSLLPIKKVNFYPFSRFLSLFSIDQLAQKGFLEAIIKLPNNKKIRIINTHLQQRKGFLSNFIRFHQLKLILSKEKNNDLPTIFVGDLNALAKDKKFFMLIKKMNFKEAEKILKKEIKPTSRPENIYAQYLFNNTQKPKKLDYVFLKNFEKNNLKLIDVETLFLNPPFSDHDPIIIKFSLNK